MACPDLDPRNGGTCANIMAKKFTCAVVAIIQVIVWGLGLLTFIFKPSSAAVLIEQLDNKAQVILYLTVMACLAFSSLLLAGVYKHRQLYVKIYLVYVVVYTVLLILSLIINIFTQPEGVGFKGFLSTVLCILLFILCFFIVRSYYLNTYCTPPPRQVGPNKV